MSQTRIDVEIFLKMKNAVSNNRFIKCLYQFIYIHVCLCTVNSCTTFEFWRFMQYIWNCKLSFSNFEIALNNFHSDGMDIEGINWIKQFYEMKSNVVHIPFYVTLHSKWKQGLNDWVLKRARDREREILYNIKSMRELK